jgi:hypothetical protein
VARCDQVDRYLPERLTDLTQEGMQYGDQALQQWRGGFYGWPTKRGKSCVSGNRTVVDTAQRAYDLAKKGMTYAVV